MSGYITQDELPQACEWFGVEDTQLEEEKRILEVKKKLKQAGVIGSIKKILVFKGGGTIVGKDTPPCGQGASMGDDLSQSTNEVLGPWTLD
ncbi:hypothetical protein I3760_08G145900 [Carya illinoinensis]|nr:hypothetical protein I3760_08G145900 [Carya illinoinensis]